MKRFALPAILAVALAGSGLRASADPAPAAAPPAPIRHLVYSFTYGTSTDLEVHSSGIGGGGMGAESGSGNMSGGGSGTSDFTGGVGDQGTIQVDVLREQPDHGLVVSVSEDAQHTRSAPAATCVVYGNTMTICDPNKKINEEELTAMSFLGTNFIDPALIDNDKHWRIQDTSPQYSMISDFTIQSNTNGAMSINEVRQTKETGSHVQTTNANGTIAYDFNKQVPTAVNEYEIARQQQGSDQYLTQKTQTILHLTSDSGVKN